MASKHAAKSLQRHTLREHLSDYTDRNGRKTRDSALDAMAQDSFPASDPPSFTGTHAGHPNRGGDAPPRMRRRKTRR